MALTGRGLKRPPWGGTRPDVAAVTGRRMLRKTNGRPIEASSERVGRDSKGPPAAGSRPGFAGVERYQPSGWARLARHSSAFLHTSGGGRPSAMRLASRTAASSS